LMKPSMDGCLYSRFGPVSRTPNRMHRRKWHNRNWSLFAIFVEGIWSLRARFLTSMLGTPK
ncbi:hypothetical protein H0H81_003483, partial [Sphagnurus paluster]